MVRTSYRVYRVDQTGLSPCEGWDDVTKSCEGVDSAFEAFTDFYERVYKNLEPAPIPRPFSFIVVSCLTVF